MHSDLYDHSLNLNELVLPVSKVKYLLDSHSRKLLPVEGKTLWKFVKSAQTGERKGATGNKESLRVKTHKWICRVKGVKQGKNTQMGKVKILSSGYQIIRPLPPYQVPHTQLYCAQVLLKDNDKDTAKV